MAQNYLDRQRFLVERMAPVLTDEPQIEDDCPLEPFYSGQWVERKRVIKAILELMGECNPLDHLPTSSYCSCEIIEAVKWETTNA